MKLKFIRLSIVAASAFLVCGSALADVKHRVSNDMLSESGRGSTSQRNGTDFSVLSGKYSVADVGRGYWASKHRPGEFVGTASASASVINGGEGTLESFKFPRQ